MHNSPPHNMMTARLHLKNSECADRSDSAQVRLKDSGAADMQDRQWFCTMRRSNSRNLKTFLRARYAEGRGAEERCYNMDLRITVFIPAC